MGFENFETHINCIYKAMSLKVVESQLVTDSWRGLLLMLPSILILLSRILQMTAV